MADILYHNKIRIFPSSNRDVNTDRYGDNFVTEYNLSSLINKLIDTSAQGFVISTSTKKLATDTTYTAPAEFNIAGYFIHVDEWETIINPDKRNNLNKNGGIYRFGTYPRQVRVYRELHSPHLPLQAQKILLLGGPGQSGRGGESTGQCPPYQKHDSGRLLRPHRECTGGNGTLCRTGTGGERVGVLPFG